MSQRFFSHDNTTNVSIAGSIPANPTFGSVTTGFLAGSTHTTDFDGVGTGYVISGTCTTPLFVIRGSDTTTLTSATTFGATGTGDASNSTTGGTITIAGGALFESSLTTGTWTSPTVSCSASTNSTSSSTGTVVVSGTLSNTQDVYVGGTGSFSGTQTWNGITSPGGCSIAKSVVCGGTTTGTTTNVTSSTTTSSSSTGALNCSSTGGLRIGGNCAVTGTWLHTGALLCGVNNAATTVNSATWTQLNLGTVLFDTSASSTMSTANANKITIPRTGYYTIQARIQCPSNATGEVGLRIFKGTLTVDQTEIAGEHMPNMGSTVAYRVATAVSDSFTSGDTLGISLYQSSGGSLSLSANVGAIVVQYLGDV